MARRLPWSGREGAGRAVVSATLILTAAALVGKPITFARDVAVAREFGATSVVDFVILAQLLPAFLVGVVSNGAVLSLPSIFRRGAAEGGKEPDGIAAALAFTRRLLTVEASVLFAGAVVVSLVLWRLGPAGAPFPPALMLLLCLQAFLDSAIALYAQTVQLTGRFARTALQYAANGLVTVLVVVLAAPLVGIWAWPLGLLLDSAWQAAFLWRALPGPRSRQAPPDTGYRPALLAAAPATALFALTLVYAVSDRVAGLLAGAGTLALWTWALRLGSAAAGAASLPVATAVFSRGHTAGDREPRLHGLAWLVSVGLSIAVAGVFLVAGPAFIHFAFGSRSVTADDLDRLVRLATFALLAAVPLAMFTVSSRAFMARGRFREPIVAFALGASLYPILIAATFASLGYTSLGLAYLVASLVAGVLATRAAVRRGVLSFGFLRPAVVTQ